MILRSEEEAKAEQDELTEQGAKYHRFADFVTIKGTGVFADMPKGKIYKRVHRLTATELVKKKYAEVIA